MDVRNWSLNRIMQLPDWCFGRRWWAGAHNFHSTGMITSVLVEEKLPDKFVIWGVYVTCWAPDMTNALRVTFRLTHALLPVEPGPVPHRRLLYGISTPAEIYEIKCPPNDYLWLKNIRQVVEAPMENIGILMLGDNVNHYEACAAVLISSIPTEVPDWLISDPGKNQL